jgi:hypothetical protein
MRSFKSFLKEESEPQAQEGAKLKHIHHAEDRPLFHGAAGFEHAKGALLQAHNHIKSGGDSSALTMKYDGSPSLVYGHHPETGKFFVASKSAFNKTPKINYTHEDIVKNHGHAPGLMDKLHAALNHLPKVVPKTGVYQGDIMHSQDDLEHKPGGKVSFTPNTITYTSRGEDADRVKKSKIGIVTHTQYHGNDASSMRADPHPDLHNFKQHPDVWQKSPNHDTKQIHYDEKSQKTFMDHMKAAESIHKKNPDMYDHIHPAHGGETGHLSTYINHTVRTGEEPSVEGLKKHVSEKSKKEIAKVKTPAAQSKKAAVAKGHMEWIDDNKKHYDNLLKMHNHLQKAKNTLVSTLEQHEGGLEHHIDGKKTGPEGFVVNHAGEPTKLVNRAEFARANLLKVRK